MITVAINGTTTYLATFLIKQKVSLTLVWFSGYMGNGNIRSMSCFHSQKQQEYTHECERAHSHNQKETNIKTRYKEKTKHLLWPLHILQCLPSKIGFNLHLTTLSLKIHDIVLTSSFTN